MQNQTLEKKKGDWVKVKKYFNTIEFPHGIRPDCCSELYPDFDIS